MRDWLAGFKPSRSDVWIAAGLGSAAFLYSFILSGAIMPALTEFGTMDVWFEADVERVFANMTDRASDQYRTRAHPLFPLLTLGPVWTLARFGVPEILTVRLGMALAAALTAIGLYAVLRLAGAGARAAGVFGLLGLVASGTMFWTVVPETHALGSVTVVLAMLVAAAKAGGKTVPEGVDLVACAGTLSFTSTNWMFGILSTWPRRRIARFGVLVLASLGLVTGLWAVQRRFVPSADFFLGQGLEAGMVLSPESFGIPGVARSFFLHSVIMPAIELVDRPSTGAWPVMLTQPSGAGSTGMLGIAGVVLWGALLVAGMIAAFRSRVRWPLAFFLGGGLAGQLVLYVYFGNETFLYAPNFLPLLIVLAGLGAIGPRGRIALVLAGLLVPIAAANNIRQLDRSMRYFETHADMERIPLRAPAERPDDPWPRRPSPREVGHEPLLLLDRGMHELGGGFSPAIGSFGVSFWVLDEAGDLLTWSSRIPGAEIVERTGTSDAGTVSRIETTTPYYRVAWRANGLRDWTLEVNDVPDGLALAVVIRGTGPGGGGPVRSIDVGEDGLQIGPRWRLEPEAGVGTAGAGIEGRAGWRSSAVRRAVQDPGGWAFARVVLPDGSGETFRLYDLRAGQGWDTRIGVLRE